MADIKGFMERNKTAREEYRRRLFKRRKRVKILFIAESPPYPRTGEYYFWRPELGEKPGDLLKYLTLALYGDRVNEKKSHQLLDQFVCDGYFLIDASEEPVNQIENKMERERAIEKNIGHLPAEVKKLDPGNIVIIKRTIYEQVRRYLTSTGYDKRILGEKGLPFPNNGHQRQFVKELGELLGSRIP